MTRATLIEQIRSRQSYLCVGLDTDPEKFLIHYVNLQILFLNSTNGSLMQRLTIVLPIK